MANDDLRGGVVPSRRGISPAIIALVVIAAAAVIFFWQNGETTTVDLWGFSWTTTIRWSLVVAALLGVILDRLFSMWWRRRRRKGDG